MLTSLSLLSLLSVAHAGVDASIEEAIENGSTVLTGDAHTVRCKSFIIHEDGRLEQSFVSIFAVDELQEGDMVDVPEDMDIAVEWRRTEWGDGPQPACSDSIEDLGQGWGGSLVINEYDGSWIADGSYQTRSDHEGDLLPDCGRLERDEYLNGDGPMQYDDEDHADEDESGVAASGCSHASGGSLTGLAFGMLVLGVLGRRRNA